MASTPSQRQFRLRSAIAGAVAVTAAIAVVVVGFSLRSDAAEQSAPAVVVPGTDQPTTTSGAGASESTTVTVPPAPVPVETTVVDTTAGTAPGGATGGGNTGGGYAPPVPQTPDDGNVPPPPQPPAPTPTNPPAPVSPLPGGDPFNIAGASLVGTINDPYGDGTAKQWLYSLPTTTTQAGCDLVSGAIRAAGYNVAYVGCGGADGRITFNGKGFGGIASIKNSGTQASIQLRVQ